MLLFAAAGRSWTAGPCVPSAASHQICHLAAVTVVAAAAGSTAVMTADFAGCVSTSHVTCCHLCPGAAAAGCAVVTFVCSRRFEIWTGGVVTVGVGGAVMVGCSAVMVGDEIAVMLLPPFSVTFAAAVGGVVCCWC